jgi:hypothetical protein
MCCGSSPKLTKKARDSESRYRAEDDLRTLTRADEIRTDKERMGHARRVHTEQLRAMQGVGRTLQGREDKTTPHTGRSRRRGGIKGRRRLAKVRA